ncbi:MAG TPA: PQQ-binding-like beta-propeller repeat protein, partial [Thermoguttaceae bacterium]|nr:PQQ-binding-like beta-propeller repeat protein [Thermoguttaceae bacterium]
TYVPRREPRPAWPEPVREVHLMAFDYAHQVVAAGGLVYFGSSADHQVRAIDLKTGRERWSFFTDAPVRFAPQAAGKRLYVASDDGCVYCLSAGEGKLIWRFRGGPRDERILGNEAMISRWPLRSGLVVVGDTVYFTAGMWPSEGVYVCALNAADGTVLWKTEAAGKFAPQGYLAVGEKSIVAPVGRADAWLIDRETGSLRAYKGMSQAIVRGDLYLAGPFTHKANENLPIPGGVPFGDRSRKITGWKLGTDEAYGNFGGKEVAAVSDDTVYLAGEGKIAAHRLPKMEQDWEIDHPPVFSLAVAGSTLVVGGENRVALLDTSKGEPVWSAEMEGRVRGLAVADGRLLVSTDQGHLVCFGPGQPATAEVIAEASGLPKNGSGRSALAEGIFRETSVTAGFCLLAGVGDGRLAYELARQSELRIYCAETNESKVAAARKLLSAAGLYGTRVTVHHIDTETLPYPDYFADLIVVDEPSAGPMPYSPDELLRVLRPCGGTAYLVSAAESSDGLESRITDEEFKITCLSANTLKIVRGELPGTGEWTHQYADPGKSASSGDRLVRWPLRILWFGKPGPGPMMNRHWRGTAPLCVAGRMFVLGQHELIAVDAYNGRELWSRQLPSVARRVVDIRGGSMAADAESVYLVTADLCLRLDAATGRLRQAYRLPIERPRFVLSSPQTFELDGLGSVEVHNAADALQLKLTTVDANVTSADRQNAPARGDSWELFFDFRPKDQRDGLYAPGAFQVIVVPATKEQAAASWHAGLWSSPPKLRVTGTLDEKGSTTTVRIPWTEIEGLVGGKVDDFDFGVILNSSDDGRTRLKRTRRFANDASYRLANCRAKVVLEADREFAPAATEPFDAEDADSLTWGHLAVSGDVILGTIAAARDTPPVLDRGRDFSSEGHDYTGPPVEKVLENVGLEGEARCVFALDKNDGRLRWVHTPQGAVPHNAVAVSNGRVYLLDKPSAAAAERAKRRGGSPSEDALLDVLDLSTGKRLWRLDQGFDGRVGLRLGKGVLLATDMKGMTAYDADDGKRLWSVDASQPMHHCSAFVRVPVIAGDWVYDEPHAYALRTGELRQGPDGNPWRWGGFRGCGTVSAADGMLFFRTGSPAMLDVAGNTGQHELPGVRPGCYINIITAGGLVLMPEASSGCGCPYNFQTTVVLATGP